MGFSALAALLYTGGQVSHLVVMYSINVFLTFTLSLLAMTRHWLGRREDPMRPRRLALFLSAFTLCATILAITVIEKFSHGGWVTLVVTAVVIILCHAIRRHYRAVSSALTRLYSQLTDLPAAGRKPADFEPGRPTAAVLVGSYGGVGIHTTLNALRTFPGYFHNVVFLCVGVIDSGRFKGEEAVEELRRETQSTVDQYVEMARRLGMPARGHSALGTDAVDEAERLCLAVAAELPRVTFFAGKVIFQREKWYQRLLHNETAFMIQKRLQWSGQTMVVLPAKVS